MKEYIINEPELYFIKPYQGYVFLVGQEVKFQLNLQKGDFNNWKTPPITWSCDNGQSGQVGIDTEFSITYTQPGIYTVTEEAPYDSNRDGVIDSKDKTVKASCKVNVIKIDTFTVTNRNGAGGQSLIDTTDDHATPIEKLYIVQDKNGKAVIGMDLIVLPQNIQSDELKSRLLWRIKNTTGGDASNWDRNHGNYMNGMPLATWTDNGNSSVIREFEVYSGFDKNNNNSLEISQYSDNEAMRKIIFIVLKVDLKLFKTGTLSSPGELISEDDEDNSLKLGLLKNDDNDDKRTGHIDNDDQTIGSQDNDIVKLTLNLLPSNKGTAQLNVNTPQNIQVFKTSGNALLTNYSVNLSSPAGDLANLATGSVDLFLEGMSNLQDEKISLIFKDLSGIERGRDEVHFAIVTLIDFSLHGPCSIVRGQMGRFEVKTNEYGADIPGMDYLSWEFTDETKQKIVERPPEEQSPIWEGILVAPGTVSAFVDFPDRGITEDITAIYSIIPRTGPDWEMPELDVFIKTYKEYYPLNPEHWKKYPMNPNQGDVQGNCTPMLRPDFIYDEQKPLNDFGEGSGPNKSIYYIKYSHVFISCRVLINRFLRGSNDPPANQTPPGIYTNYNNITSLYAQSVELHETWGTNNNPPSGLVADADGHVKLYKPHVDSINLRSIIEPELGFGEELEFKTNILDILINKKNELYPYGNPNHIDWLDPFPTNTWVDFWYEPIGWYLSIPGSSY